MSQPAYVHPQDVFFDDAVCRTYDTRTHALTSGRRPISYAQIDNEYNSLMNSRHTSINIPTPLRRRRQLFCRLLRERGGHDLQRQMGRCGDESQPPSLA